MSKHKRKLTVAEKAEKKLRRKEYMTVFINGKQKRVKRPQTIDGLDMDDPESAITAARTLLETVCKHILDSKRISYDENKIQLHELYKLTPNELSLSPNQYTEVVFKQILGGCSAVVNGLGTLRNRLGDAHGKGKAPVKPAPRHAELAVNLSGALSLFLISTFNERNKT